MGKKSWKKTAAVGVICAATGAGVLVNGAIDTPNDLLQDDTSAVIIEAQTDEDMVAADDDERKGSPLRRWLLSLPIGVRAIVGIPLWALGWGITELFVLLWQAALSPIGSTVLSWLLTAALALGAFAVTAKVIFPDLSLKKILRPRNILIVVGGTLLFGVIDTVLPLFWTGYPRIGRWLRLGGAALMVGCGCLSLRKLHHRKEEKAPVITTEQQAMALADTVCPPRRR